MGSGSSARSRELSASGAVSLPRPEVVRALEKKCCGCGTDVSARWRYKDAHWDYWCRDCRAGEDRSVRFAAIRRATLLSLLALLVLSTAAAAWFWS